MENNQKEESDSQSISSDEWQDLSKSEYAKVIFTELCHDSDSGCVRCKFHITDEVQSDPSDFVGLYRVGYEDLDQCIVVQELSLIKSETESTLYSCIFESEVLPQLEEGFYQFLYVHAKNEICGASMPFEIKDRHLNHYNNIQRCVLEELSSEDGDFLMVKTQLEKQNEALLEQLKHFKGTLTEEINNKTMLQNKVLQLEEEKLCLRTLYEDQLKKVTEGKQQLHAQYDAEIQKLKSELRSVRELGLVQLQEKDKFSYELQGQMQVLKMSERQLQEEVHLLRNKIREAEVCMSRMICNDQVKLLSEQLEDQKCMVKALDHSKQMAIKEIATLTASLTHRTDSLNRMKHECASAKENLIKAEEQNEKILKEKSEVEIQLVELSERLEKLTVVGVIKDMDKADLKAKYKNEKKLLEEAIASITKLTKESSEKNELIENLKSNMKEHNDYMDKQLLEMMGRLQEAYHLFHFQNQLIKNLGKVHNKRKLSSKNVPASIPSPKSMPVSSPHCHTSNDSDTGEHNAERYFAPIKADPPQDATADTEVIPAEATSSDAEASPTCWKKKIVKIASANAQQDNENTPLPSTSEDQTQNQISQSSADEPVAEKPILSESKEEPVQGVGEQDIKQSRAEEPTTESPTLVVTPVKSNVYKTLMHVHNEAERNARMILCCPFCPDAWSATGSGDAPVDFFDHLDNVHQLRMCPFCGHMFASTLPDRYLLMHVQHRHAEGQQAPREK